MSNDLATQYKSMSDAEMLELGDQYASLTDEAQALVRSEFARRNLEVPDAPDEPDSVAFRDMRTIRKYRDQAEAVFARSVLESAGISAFLCDENMVRLNWGVSNMIGGIRLQVSEADVASAETILSEPIPQSIAIPGGPDYSQPVCPKCESLDISFNTVDAKVSIVTLYMTGIPIPAFGKKDYWHCHNCGTDWTDDTTEELNHDA